MSPSDVPANIQSLVENAKDLFDKSFSTDPIEGFIHVSTAPGRVNLIGEHTDYTGGYVLPLAIGYGTVCYGRGSIVKRTNGDMKCRVVSMNNPQDVVEFEADPSSVPSVTNKWTNYVQGVVLQYLADLKGDEIFSFDMAIAGDVPLGSGLSSSASLEVATAVFLEALMRESGADALSMKGDRERKKDRAVRCQRAENVFCNVPCGIMDQFVSSAGCQGKLLLIDCRSLDVREVAMGMDNTGCKPVLVVTNSNVQHNLGDSEYPIRVKQCKGATARLALVNSSILSLRDATMDDIAAASSKGLLDKVLLQRARHVVSENKRTEDTACALEKGDWSRVGQLMNESHTSMKDDYEVSCKEIDILVELAQGFEGVYGSRLTGGGFGGCTVTLVREDSSQRLIDYLKEQYKEKIGTDCTCFKTTPSEGARELHI